MEFVFMAAGAALIFLGLQKKSGSDKKIGEMTGSELGRSGLKMYLKMMMIVGGAALILIGAVISCTF